jgi:hypothetical protein
VEAEGVTCPCGVIRNGGLRLVNPPYELRSSGLRLLVFMAAELLVWDRVVTLANGV